MLGEALENRSSSDEEHELCCFIKVLLYSAN